MQEIHIQTFGLYTHLSNKAKQAQRHVKQGKTTAVVFNQK